MPGGRVAEVSAGKRSARSSCWRSRDTREAAVGQKFSELAHPLPCPLQGCRRQFAKRIAIVARKMTGILETTFQGNLNDRAAFIGFFEHFPRAVEPNPLGKIRR